TAKHARGLNLMGLTLVLGGGTGNLIDRMTYGHVTDFLILGYGPLHTGIFNLADVTICLGTILILWANYTPEIKKGARA
ncbi:MAG: signal peptidase II, partial [Bdellovibrionales bacterium]